VNQLYIRGIVAVVAGMVFNLAGDLLLGAQIEIFKGISTFTVPWMLDVFLVPFIAGVIVAKIYGRKNGKWLACLPPLFVRCLTYSYMYLFVFNDGKDFFFHLNLFYWGPCVILVVEAANFGGILAEVMAGAYKRKSIQTEEFGVTNF
jgi:hypothetical protein